MSLHGKPLNQITANDLLAVKTNAIPENIQLDYKSELPGTSKDHKRAFVCDVSALANTIGGDLVIGVAEEGGIPTDVQGCQVADPDAEKLRLKSTIRDNSDPRLAGPHVHL
jgi:predicted HTH transcriptional regulator